MAVNAQDRGTGIVGDGYYRVHNFGSDRYIYVRDNVDESDLARQVPDFGAIQLWKDASKTIYDAASVIYIKEYNGGRFNLQAQGTGVEELTGFTVRINALTGRTTKGLYEVYVTKDGVTQYLDDERTNSRADGQLGINNKEVKYRYWIADKIDVNSSTNYFGIKPTIQLNDKYYRPFFSSFAFKTVSPNMHVYYVSKVLGSEATLQEIGGEIPPCTPVIIECASANPSDNRIDILYSKSAAVGGNKLAGVYFCNGERGERSVDAYTAFNASTMRVLTAANGKLVLSNNEDELLDSEVLEQIDAVDWTTEDDIEVVCIPANTCYLKADAGTPAVLDIRFEGLGLDEILAENSDADAVGVYSLSGTRLRSTNDVRGLPAGLYVVGGVKVVIK